MYFTYDNLRLRYEPFPIGLVKPVLDSGLYKELVAAYPPVELFKYIPKIGKKYSLSERYHRKQYQQFIRGNPAWRDFHSWLKSPEFIEGVLEALRNHHVDVGYKTRASFKRQVMRSLKRLSRFRLPLPEPQLSARFEFSMLPADGGSVIPHTDAPGKIITLVVSMIRDDEWDPVFGGGTDINRPKDTAFCYNQLNRRADFQDVEVLDTFDFTPNQAVIFVKTFNSWHSVRPMLGQGSGAMRKTLTINIEAES